MAKLPAFMFYPGDWKKDPELQGCSIFARGLLVDLLCTMHEAKDRGRLKWPDGSPWTDEEIAGSVSSPDTLEAKMAGLAELERKGVLKRDDDGVLYSSRVVRDEEKRQKKITAGSKGGSKTQANRKQTRKQNPEIEIEIEIENENETNGSRRKRFRKPTQAELEAYAAEKSLTIDAEAFLAYYESNGWKVGRNPMKCWKSAATGWARRNMGGQGEPPAVVQI